MDCTGNHDHRIGQMNSIHAVANLSIKANWTAPVLMLGCLRAFDPGRDIETGLEVEPLVMSEKFTHGHAKRHKLRKFTGVIKWNSL